MNEAVFVLYLVNFALIGALPQVFFKRDGRFNLMWWITASPFFLCTLLLILSFAGYVPRMTGVGNNLARAFEMVSVGFSIVSVGLICFTLGTHRVPIALWHQDNDAPTSIVTWGAYRWIRHPFYASFLLALFGAMIFCPHWGTLLTFVEGFVILNFTASREEKRLSASEFGAEYVEYIRRTGRFLPAGSAGVPPASERMTNMTKMRAGRPRSQDGRAT